MTEQSNAGGTGSPALPSGGGQSGQPNNPFRAANPPPAGSESASVVDRSRPQQQQNPRSRGHSPARDAREQRQAQPEAGASSEQPGASGDQGQGQQQQPGAEPEKVTISGVDYTADQVNEALKFKAESDIRKTALPKDANGYEVKLPSDFKAPEGAAFEFNKDDPLLARARELAHQRGLSQEAFSDFLGIYAANRIGEQQMLATARNAEMGKLGSAAGNRIAAVETWLKSQVGAKANLIVSQMRAYPVASMIEMFEHLARASSDQGSAPYSQGHRGDPDPPPQVPQFTGGNFAQVRAAQDALSAKLRGGR